MSYGLIGYRALQPFAHFYALFAAPSLGFANAAFRTDGLNNDAVGP